MFKRFGTPFSIETDTSYMYALLSRLMYPSEPVPRYRKGQYGMPLDKYHEMFGPAAVIAEKDRELLLMRPVCAEACLEAANRIKKASCIGQACLPNIQSLLTFLPGPGPKSKVIKGEGMIVNNTPAWIWQQELKVNSLYDAHYGNAWLVVEGDRAHIFKNLYMNQGISLPVQAIIDSLLELHPAFVAYEGTRGPTPKEHRYNRMETDFPFPTDSDYCLSKWKNKWETPENSYPCLVLGCINNRTKEPHDEKNIKIVFGSANLARSARDMIAKSEIPKNAFTETTLNLYRYCTARIARCEGWKGKHIAIEPTGWAGVVKNSLELKLSADPKGTTRDFVPRLTANDAIRFDALVYFGETISIKRPLLLSVLDTLAARIEDYCADHKTMTAQK